MTRILWVALLVPALAVAQPAPPQKPTNGIVMDPVEIDSFGCRFVARSLVDTGSQPANWITVTETGTPRNDGAPSAILTASSTSGTDAAFTLSPDQGCAVSGCRTGKSYEIRIRPLDSDGNRPLCVVGLHVQRGAVVGGGTTP